ncbi:MAG: hypothetical protein L0Y71_14005 [Gemmataceae bacterium]|nr:hypothetical protein [Gemmataceae bacterium]
MKFTCTIERRGGGWLARHSGSTVGTVEVAAATRAEALEKIRNELQYRIELCPCSGVSGDRAEVVTEES